MHRAKLRWPGWGYLPEREDFAILGESRLSAEDSKDKTFIEINEMSAVSCLTWEDARIRIRTDARVHSVLLRITMLGRGTTPSSLCSVPGCLLAASEDCDWQWHCKLWSRASVMLCCMFRCWSCRGVIRLILEHSSPQVPSRYSE